MSIEAIFKRLEDAIRLDDYEDHDVLALIADFIPEAAPIAYAMMQHHIEILRMAGDNDDLTYTDIIVELYRRTFFDPIQAARYGTNHMVNDPVALAHFVEFITARQNASAPQPAGTALAH